MSKHYTKLIVLLILLLTVAFFLSLAFGSAEDEPCEMCQLCKNKALVKGAILAFGEDPYDANLPEQFDPNYVQYGPADFLDPSPVSNPLGGFAFGGLHCDEFAFKFIIAEGDMVAVRVFWIISHNDYGFDSFTRMAIFRITNGKIVKGWIAPARDIGWEFMADDWE